MGILLKQKQLKEEAWNNKASYVKKDKKLYSDSNIESIGNRFIQSSKPNKENTNLRQIPRQSAIEKRPALNDSSKPNYRKILTSSSSKYMKRSPLEIPNESNSRKVSINLADSKSTKSTKERSESINSETKNKTCLKSIPVKRGNISNLSLVNYIPTVKTDLYNHIETKENSILGELSSNYNQRESLLFKEDKEYVPSDNYTEPFLEEKSIISAAKPKSRFSLLPRRVVSSKSHILSTDSVAILNEKSLEKQIFPTGVATMGDMIDRKYNSKCSLTESFVTESNCDLAKNSSKLTEARKLRYSKRNLVEDCKTNEDRLNGSNSEIFQKVNSLEKNLNKESLFQRRLKTILIKKKYIELNSSKSSNEYEVREEEGGRLIDRIRAKLKNELNRSKEELI